MISLYARGETESSAAADGDITTNTIRLSVLSVINAVMVSAFCKITSGISYGFISDITPTGLCRICLYLPSVPYIILYLPYVPYIVGLPGQSDPRPTHDMHEVSTAVNFLSRLKRCIPMTWSQLNYM